MDAQELRNLQEAYMEMYNPEKIDEGLRILPRKRMSDKAASKRLKAVGTKLKSKFTTAKGTTARNVEDEKSKKLVSQANKIDKVAAKHIPSDVEAKERKNRGGSWNPRNPMGSNEYAERQFAKNRAKLGIREQVNIYDIILSHLLDEGYAETPEAAEVIMVNMSEEWRETILEAEVLAQKGGVPGTVNVNKTKEGGFFGIGSREVSKPVSGSFKEKDVSSKDAARYNTAVDRKFGSSDNIDSTPAANVQYAANRAGHSGYMKVNNPSSIPDTGIPNRPSPGRSFDQNQARTMSSDIVRMNKQR